MRETNLQSERAVRSTTCVARDVCRTGLCFVLRRRNDAGGCEFKEQRMLPGETVCRCRGSGGLVERREVGIVREDGVRRQRRRRGVRRKISQTRSAWMGVRNALRAAQHNHQRIFTKHDASDRHREGPSPRHKSLNQKQQSSAPHTKRSIRVARTQFATCGKKSGTQQKGKRPSQTLSRTKVVFASATPLCGESFPRFLWRDCTNGAVVLQRGYPKTGGGTT